MWGSWHKQQQCQFFISIHRDSEWGFEVQTFNTPLLYRHVPKPIQNGESPAPQLELQYPKYSGFMW